MRIRTLLIATGVLALTGAALGVGIALGSGSAHRDAAGPPKAAPGERVLRSTPHPTLPKSQAYAYFYGDGTIVGPSKKVVAVHHAGTGFYCVQLAPSIHVSPSTYATAFVDYYNTATFLAVAEQYSNSSYCAVTLGFPNSVGIVTAANDTGTSALTDEPVFFAVP